MRCERDVLDEKRRILASRTTSSRVSDVRGVLREVFSTLPGFEIACRTTARCGSACRTTGPRHQLLRGGAGRRWVRVRAAESMPVQVSVPSRTTAAANSAWRDRLSFWSSQVPPNGRGRDPYPPPQPLQRVIQPLAIALLHGELFEARDAALRAPFTPRGARSVLAPWANRRPGRLAGITPKRSRRSGSAPGKVRILTSLSLFSGFSSDSTVPAGSLAKASSVGANTTSEGTLAAVQCVDRPRRAFTAVTSVSKLPLRRRRCRRYS